MWYGLVRLVGTNVRLFFLKGGLQIEKKKNHYRLIDSAMEQAKIL